MRTLAERLGVTVRALYNHVDDRQAVVDLVAHRMMEGLPIIPLDEDDWRQTVRALYRQAREVYRHMGRTVLVALDETVTPVELHPNRIVAPERELAFLTRCGLSLEQALMWRTQFLIDVFGWVMLIDYRYDRTPEEQRPSLRDPVPAPWLDAHPEVDAPLARSATRLAALSSDAAFEAMIDRAIGVIATIRGE